MTRNSDPWLRFYVRTLNNPKVQRLASGDFKGWVNLLCLAKEHDGSLPSVEDVAFRLRLSKRKVETLLKSLRSKGLVDGDRMHDWDEMQYHSDSSTERVKQHRERAKEHQRNVSSNVPVTVQNRNRTETEKKQSKEPPKPPARKLADVLPENFVKFWDAYPRNAMGRKVGKLAALKRWKTIRPSPELAAKILATLAIQTAQQHWRNGKGEDYVPNPATWLNEGRWTDETGETQQQRKDREFEETMKQVRLEIDNDT